jgi:hypothetical protein
MSLRNLIFKAEVVEQSFGAVVLPHHDQQASDDENPTEHGRMLFSNMLPLNLILLIDVTFSTPTPDNDSWRLERKPDDSIRWRQVAIVEYGIDSQFEYSLFCF